MLMKCLDIMSDHNVKLAGHIQNLVGQCQLLFPALGYVNFDLKCLLNERTSHKLTNLRRGKLIFT